MANQTVTGTRGAQEILQPQSALADLGIQIQCFAHAPTEQALDLIRQLYHAKETRQAPEFARSDEKIKMFLSLCLDAHPEWPRKDADESQLASQAQVRRTWLLSRDGDSKRKLDHIWHGYFATGDEAFARKVIEIADDTAAGKELRETAVWSYTKLARECYAALGKVKGAQPILQIGAQLFK